MTISLTPELEQAMRRAARRPNCSVSRLARDAIEALPPEGYRRTADLAEQHADLCLGATDASVIAAAERLGAKSIVTLDRKHFSVVHPKHVDAFELLPELD